jgi:hypothetical protein
MIRATASADPSDVNSVIQLAGLKPAQVPASHTLSADTQLLLSAIGSLERSLGSRNGYEKADKYFRIDNGKVMFEDGSSAELGESVCDVSYTKLGILIDIHPADEKIFVKGSGGKVTPFAASSIKSRGLTSLPF